MSFRTTEAADRDIAGLYADGEERFGTQQAERYQDELLTPCGHSTCSRRRSAVGGERTLALLPEADVPPPTQIDSASQFTDDWKAVFRFNIDPAASSLTSR